MGSCCSWVSTCSHHCGAARTLLASKGAPEELDQYRSFTINLAHRVAAAHKEKDGKDGVGEAEQAAIDSVEQALA